jgi:outer membrane receptor protein involved in Fe transport
LFGNASFIHSEVSFGRDSLKFGRTRSLQGQSPYIYNAGLMYQDQKGYAGSLQVNYSAPRIYIAGDMDNPGILENGRTVLDLQLAKTFEKQNLELKLNVKDILADDFLRFYDIDGNGKYDSNKDRIFQRGTMGRVISLGLTYKF